MIPGFHCGSVLMGFLFWDNGSAKDVLLTFRKN